MKFLKTIRFDTSDIHVFPSAAEPDEWSIAGGFRFSGIREEVIKGKLKQAFSNGFLSVESFGFSTFTSVADITKDELEFIVGKLADRFVEEFGAPSAEAARAVADQEIEFVLGMCADVPINSIFALRRELDEDGELRESFSLVEAPTGPVHAKVWEIVE